jgi:hypothetical protein
MFVPLTPTAKKNSARAFGGHAGGGRMAACLGRGRALPQHGPPRRVQRPYIRWIAFLNHSFRSGPIGVPDRPSYSRGEGCTTTSHQSPFRSQKNRFSPGENADEPPPVVRVFCSNLRAPLRGTSLGPLLCVANEHKGEACAPRTNTGYLNPGHRQS